VPTPVLALHGERDRVGPVEISARLAEVLPCGSLGVVAGAGHWIHVDRPDEFCTLVGEFLNA
jgi:2-hydroxymuconate-semialdehyde hydrolase